MNAKIVAYVFGVGLLGATALSCAQTAGGTDASFISPAVRALTDRVAASDVRAEGAEARISGLCAESTEVGDLTEALLLAGFDVFTVVRDTILACGKGGAAPEVAAQVATRALLLKGRTARPLIDAGVLAAAAEIERRRRAAPAGGAVGAAAGPTQAQRDLERERLERMMQKGLIDDEYRRYIEERRRFAENSYPEPYAYPGTYDYGDPDVRVYGILFTEALLGGGYLDETLDQRADPGGYASAQ